MPIGIIGRKRLALIDWGSRCLPTIKEKAYIHLFVLFPSMLLKHQDTFNTPTTKPHRLLNLVKETGSARMQQMCYCRTIERNHLETSTLWSKWFGVWASEISFVDNFLTENSRFCVTPNDGRWQPMCGNAVSHRV